MLVPKGDEELPLEPSLPIVALSEFRGGNQVPNWDVPDKDFKMGKEKPLMPLLLKHWERQDPTDLLIKLGAQQLRCNRLRFMCHSKYAMEHIKAGQGELVLPEDQLTYEGLVLICDWINKPVALLDRRHIVCVLAAAVFLGVDPLVKQVWYCLDLSSDFREDQAFIVSNDVMQLGDRMPVGGVDTTMLHRIQCFFLTLVASREFVLLSVRHVCCLLSSENVAVNSEAEIFYTAVRWLAYEWPSRTKHLAEIMATVRLMLLPRQFIFDLQTVAVDPTLRRITELPEFHQIIYDAYSAQTMMVFNDGTEIFGQLYDIFHIDEPVRRPFIYDQLCAYHVQHPHDEPRLFSYAQFLAYLRILQTGGAYTWRNLKVQYVDSPYVEH